MLKHIDTLEDYKEFQKRVMEFKDLENVEVFSQVCDEEGDTQDPSFSWSPCDCCKRGLGGSRYKIVAGPVHGEVFEYRICTDCLYYLEYGHLDDVTMDGIK